MVNVVVDFVHKLFESPDSTKKGRQETVDNMNALTASHGSIPPA
jgi:hypothetical protein